MVAHGVSRGSRSGNKWRGETTPNRGSHAMFPRPKAAPSRHSPMADFPIFVIVIDPSLLPARRHPIMSRRAAIHAYRARAAGNQ